MRKWVHNSSFHIIILRWIEKFFCISISSIRDSGLTLLKILFGSIAIYPIVSKLPLLGWDWFFFFNLNNPTYNLLSNQSAYPPFTRYIIQLFTWMDWRNSLILLNSITILTMAIATWKNGGRYLGIILSLTAPPLWLLLWVGHPDGLVLLGLVTGIIPLIIMKPILSIFSIFSNRKLFAWTGIFILLTLIIWPGWLFSLGQATIQHEAAMGWAELGWPLIVVGIILFIGAGKDPYRLMAAGCFITPYLMPYHMVVLLPAIGKPSGWKQILLWASSLSVILGTGLGGNARLISFIFPLTAYCLCGTFSTYKMNLRKHIFKLNLILPKIFSQKIFNTGSIFTSSSDLSFSDNGKPKKWHTRRSTNKF